MWPAPVMGLELGQDRVNRRGELPGPVPDQEPETRGAITWIH